MFGEHWLSVGEHNLSFYSTTRMFGEHWVSAGEHQSGGLSLRRRGTHLCHFQRNERRGGIYRQASRVPSQGQSIGIG